MDSYEYYINREISWLGFNDRVLEEALDKTNPIMERLKFLSITSSNLDEFFMVRLSSLLHNYSDIPDAAGLTPKEVLSECFKLVHDMVNRQYRCFTRNLVPAMEKENIKFLKYNELDDAQKRVVDSYFGDTVFQVLTPMAIDQNRPFPNLNNLTIYLFLELTADGGPGSVRLVEWNEIESRWIIKNERVVRSRYALVPVPPVLPRIFPLPSKEGERFILLEDIIMAHIDRLFLGHKVIKNAQIRITRDSDFDIDEDDIADILDEVSRQILERKRGEPVRMEVSKGITATAKRLLEQSLKLTPERIYEINGPLDLTPLMSFSFNPKFINLRVAPERAILSPDFPPDISMFAIIKNRDILVHHPYMSFDPVIRFVQEAAADPDVLAIKHTLYRVSGQSPIINALIAAADNGKQVSVLMEIKARFDEENNIHMAKLLEKSGVHLSYGLAGLKTHCKVCLVVRKESDTIRRYMHFGTGNYNEKTAQIYTDIGFFTSRETLGHDASKLFNVLTGFSKTNDWHKLAVAPFTLRTTFLRLIEREIQYANANRPAYIYAKMNSLSDISIIQALYRASQAGVKIHLIVRGICCLRSGVPGISENIIVSSIIDRYLEHSRVYVFGGGESPKVYLSSADIMARNIDRRVEVMFPIDDTRLKTEIIDIMKIIMSDNVKRRVQQPDGIYKIQPKKGEKVHSQLEIHKFLKK